MDDYSGSVMIALLPMDVSWCRQRLPHMTLVYAGEKKDLPPTAFNELAKDAASIALVTEAISLNVEKVDVYGDEEKVDVLVLEPSPKLWAMRRFVEHWNASKHPFSPHATIGPTNPGMSPVNLPTHLAFDRIHVAFGDESMTFWFKM